MVTADEFAALVAAHVLRFLAVSAGTLDAGFARVPASLDQAAASLGAGGWSRLWRVQLPLLRTALTAAALLVLALAGGGAAWWFGPGPGGTATVPKLVAQQQGAVIVPGVLPVAQQQAAGV